MLLTIWPFESNLDNIYDFCNDLIFTYTLVFMLLASDFTSGLWVKTLSGYFLVATLCLSFIFNIGKFLVLAYIDLKKTLIKVYQKFRS